VKSKEISNRVYDPEDDPTCFPLPNLMLRGKALLIQMGILTPVVGRRRK